jgi:hypothetical protein
MLRIGIVAGLITVLPLTMVQAQTAPLASFDNEHDYPAKERLLNALANQYPDAGPALLRLAQSTQNTDTRWMAMRGMATLHYTAAAPFLEASLKDSDALVRANAARAIFDLRIADASPQLLAMFAAEKDPGAIQQASLALSGLGIKAALPSIREKIPIYTGQTRGWLLQALGRLGNADDVPFVAAYLENQNDTPGEFPATGALQDLTGVNFGYPRTGLSYPSPEMLKARAWWNAHKDAWPRCDDCSRKN